MIFDHVGDNKLVAGSCNGHVSQSVQLILGPNLRLKVIEAEQKDHGIIQAFDAVDGGYGDTIGGDVVSFF